MEVTSEEEVHDGNVLKKLVKGTSENNDAGGGVRRVLAGGGVFTYVCIYVRTYVHTTARRVSVIFLTAVLKLQSG